MTETLLLDHGCWRDHKAREREGMGSGRCSGQKPYETGRVKALPACLGLVYDVGLFSLFSVFTSSSSFRALFLSHLSI